MKARATNLQGLDGQSSFSWEWLEGPERSVSAKELEVPTPEVTIEPLVRLRPSGLAERLWAA